MFGISKDTGMLFIVIDIFLWADVVSGVGINISLMGSNMILVLSRMYSTLKLEVVNVFSFTNNSKNMMIIGVIISLINKNIAMSKRQIAIIMHIKNIVSAVLLVALLKISLIIINMYPMLKCFTGESMGFLAEFFVYIGIIFAGGSLERI